MDYLQAIEAEQERRNTELATLRAALAASEQKWEQAATTIKTATESWMAEVRTIRADLLAAQNDARRLREALTHTLSKIKAATKSMHAMPYIFKLPLFIEDALAAEPTSETKL